MKNFQYLPTCCYYPTHILLVDDNLDLLKDIAFALKSSPYKYKSKYSTSPQEIIEILKQQGNTMECFTQKYIYSSEEFYNPSKTILNVDIPAIHKQIYAEPPRFSQYLTLIVDFAMPDMSGLELCQKIRGELKLPVKIIMLTGEADQSTAIKAFNENLIDRFIVKSCPNYIEKLLLSIHELHTEYFKELTHFIIETSATFQNAVRKQPEFIELFNNIIQDYQAVEYYLLDDSGSFLFLDVNKKATRLIVKSEDDMRFLVEIAEDDRHTHATILEALRNKQKLTYFPDEKSVRTPPMQWHLYEAKCLSTPDPIYYAIIEMEDHYPFEKDLISYRQYLNSH